MEKPKKNGCEGHGIKYSPFCGGCHKAKARNQAIDEYEKWHNQEISELVNALKTMFVATDFDAPLPKGHPGHKAYLMTVARPRAEQAIAKAEVR